MRRCGQMVKALFHTAASTGKPPLPRNLVDALRRAKTLDRFGLGFMQPDLSIRELTWQNVVLAAERRAMRFLEIGLVKGQRVALFAHDEEPFALAFFGAILAGLVPVPISPPWLTGDAELHRKRIAAIVTRCSATCIVGPAELATTLDALLALSPTLSSSATYEQLAAPCEQPAILADVTEPDPTDLCLLQFTSGSTSQPKGVELTHGNLLANVEALHGLLETDIERRVGVTWTPLFHDMGLIGSLIPTALFGGRHVFIPPALFARKPQIWLETIHRYRATGSTANNFALRAAIKRLPADAILDLSCLEVIVVGSEPVHPEVSEAFIAALRPHGLNEAALSPAYGMAETTLAISTSRKAERLRVIAIAREPYERERRVRLALPGEASLRLVDCGIPLPGHELAIADADANPLPPNCVGEIMVRGPSVSRGYFGDPDATRAVFQDGWIRTGDLGFVHDDRVFVSGRLKDLIIIAGRNLYPQDIEWTVSQLAEVRSGHVIAFSIPGPEGEQLVVLAERASAPFNDDLERSIRGLIVREFGVNPHDVVAHDARSLPKTTSGKPQRAQCREDYLSGRLARRSALEKEAIE